jgi:hypothetical protein
MPHGIHQDSSSRKHFNKGHPTLEKMPLKQIVAVTISRYPVTWNIPEVPWFCFVENVDLPLLDDRVPDRKEEVWARAHVGPRRYITYLAAKRNMAVKLALEKYSDSTDILMCDTYYLNQVSALKQLISDYYAVQEIEEAALGGASWGRIRTRLEHYWKPHKEWHDKWGVPDLMFTPYGWRPEKDNLVNSMLNPPLPGLFHTSSLTGIHIFPRTIWDKGSRYGVFNDLHGCEHNYLFEHSGIPRYTDFNAEFYRERIYPFIKCIRMTLHLRRFMFFMKRRPPPDYFVKEQMDKWGQYRK